MVALVCPYYEAVDSESVSHAELEILMVDKRKLLNIMVAANEGASRIKSYSSEFEKMPKKSIKRYLYSASF